MPNLTQLPETIRQRLGYPPSLVRKRLLDKEFVVRKGTIREHPDKDDAWLFACAAHAHCAIDVGSNIGQAALLMLLSNKLERLVLIDPNPDALSLAADNLIRNDLARNASFVCAFVSDSAGEIKRFWTVGAGSAGSAYPDHAKTAARKNRHFEVPTVTLDGIVEQLHLVPDLVKVDVEGSEYLVLVGAKQCASKGNTRFFVEMHSNAKLPMVENAAQVLRWCEEQDYRAWYLKDHVALERPEQLQHRGRCHLLLQPKDWSFPDWLTEIDQSDPVTKAFVTHARTA